MVTDSEGVAEVLAEQTSCETVRELRQLAKVNLLLVYGWSCSKSRLQVRFLSL